MAKGVNIPIAADAKGVITEAKKVEGALDDVIDSLDDVGDAGKDAGKEADKGLDKIGTAADDAGKDVDALERKFKDSFDAVKKSSSTAGKDLGDNVKHGTDKAGEGLDEFKGEADGTAREVAASFDGSAESIAGGFQELAANAFAGFGPAGAVAGLAAAAGIGLVTKSMQEAKEKAQETAEKVAEIASELIDLGSTDLGPEQVKDALKDLASTAEDSKNALVEIKDQADEAGISYRDYARGVAGDSDALKRSYDEVDGALDDLEQGYKDTLDAQGNITAATGEFEDAHAKRRDALKDVAEKLLEQNGLLDDGSEAYKAYKDAAVTANDDVSAAVTRHKEAVEDQATAVASMADPSDVYNAALQTTTDAAKQWAQDQADATLDATDSWEDFATDATASLDDVLKELNGRVAKEKAFQNNLETLGRRGFGALADELRAGGPEANAAVTDLLAKGTNSQVQKYAADQGYLTGQNLAQGAAGGVSAGKPGVARAVSDLANVPVPQISIPVTVDLANAKTQLRQFTDGSYRVQVNGVYVGMKMI